MLVLFYDTGVFTRLEHFIFDNSAIYLQTTNTLCYVKGEKVRTPLDKDDVGSGPLTNIRLRHYRLLRGKLSTFLKS